MDNKYRVASEIFHGLLLVALAAVVMPDLAFAQAARCRPGRWTGRLRCCCIADGTTTELGPVAPVISALFWLGGAVLMGAGALKLKEHAENPTQTPMRQGISRMAVGAVLLTLPFFAQFAANTLAAGNQAISYGAFVQPTTAQ